MPGKVRVHELAKELGVENKFLLAWLKENGVFAKSASSRLEPPASRKVRAAFADRPPESRATESVPRPSLRQLADQLGRDPVRLMMWLNNEGIMVGNIHALLEPAVEAKVRGTASPAVKAGSVAAISPAASRPVRSVQGSRPPPPGKPVRFDALARELQRTPAELTAWLKSQAIVASRPEVVIPAAVAGRARTGLGRGSGLPVDDPPSPSARRPPAPIVDPHPRQRVRELAQALAVEQRDVLRWLRGEGNSAQNEESWVEAHLVKRAHRAKAAGGLKAPPWTPTPKPGPPIADARPAAAAKSASSSSSPATPKAGDTQRAQSGPTPLPAVTDPAPTKVGPAQASGPATPALASDAALQALRDKLAEVDTARPSDSRAGAVASEEALQKLRDTLAQDATPRVALRPDQWRHAATPLHASDPRQLDDYLLLGRLGQGGMGTVYRARRDGTVGEVALKTLQPHLYVDQDALRRFRREAKVLERVGGAFTARVTDSGTDQGRPYLVLELLDGLTLESAAELVGPLPSVIVEAVAIGLAHALAALHQQDIVHRDLKPSNVMLTTAGLKVIDFGIARLTESTAYTQTGGLLGTWVYMPPEQFTTPNDLTPAVDVFAWATTVLFAATGRAPYSGQAPAEIMNKILAGPPDTLGAVTEPRLASLLGKALHSDPAARPTPRELISALAPDEDDVQLRKRLRQDIQSLLATE